MIVLKHVRDNIDAQKIRKMSVRLSAHPLNNWPGMFSDPALFSVLNLNRVLLTSVMAEHLITGGAVVFFATMSFNASNHV